LVVGRSWFLVSRLPLPAGLTADREPNQEQPSREPRAGEGTLPVGQLDCTGRNVYIDLP
jgi:hypothetical protein